MVYRVSLFVQDLEKEGVIPSDNLLLIKFSKNILTLRILQDEFCQLIRLIKDEAINILEELVLHHQIKKDTDDQDGYQKGEDIPEGDLHIGPS